MADRADPFGPFREYIASACERLACDVAGAAQVAAAEELRDLLNEAADAARKRHPAAVELLRAALSEHSRPPKKGERR